MGKTLYMKRVMDRLVPADRISAELLAELAADKQLKCEITQPRNLKHHNKFFALIHAVFPHQSAYLTRDDLRDELTIAAGHCHMVKDLRTGQMKAVADSIAHDKMDQTAFEPFYDACVNIILTRILPGVSKRDLEDQVMDILAGRQSNPQRAKERA